MCPSESVVLDRTVTIPYEYDCEVVVRLEVMNVEDFDATVTVDELIDVGTVTPMNPELLVELLDELWDFDVIVGAIVSPIVVGTGEVKPAASVDFELADGVDPPLEIGDEEFE